MPPSQWAKRALLRSRWRGDLLRLVALIFTSASCWLVLRWALKAKNRRRVSTDEGVCSEQALLTWARSRGIEAPRITVGQFVYEDPLAEGDYWLDTIRERRGILALEEIRRGEVVARVPWKTCISTEHLRNSSHPLASMATAEAESLEQHELLAIFLLYEYHQPAGPWAPYLCLLPRKLTSTVFWPSKMLERLPADGPLLRHTLAIKKALANRYHTVVFPTVSRYSKDFPLDLLTLPNFLWAIATVKARNWIPVCRVPCARSRAILPAGCHPRMKTRAENLVNHRAPKGGGARLQALSLPRPTRRDTDDMALGVWETGVGDEEIVLELLAGSNYSRGQEIFVSYGAKCNDELLLDYGFSNRELSPPCSWGARAGSAGAGPAWPGSIRGHLEVVS